MHLPTKSKSTHVTDDWSTSLAPDASTRLCEEPQAGLALKRGSQRQPKRNLRSQHRTMRLGLEMNPVHLGIAKIALQSLATAHDRCADAVKQHFDCFACRT